MAFWERSCAPSSPPYALGLRVGRPDRQAMSIETDKAFRILLPIDVILLEGRHIETVQRPRRPAADNTAGALVELEARRTGDVPLRLVHRSLKHFALRGVPISVVNHLGVPRDERLAQVQNLPVERERFHRPVRDMQYRPAGRLVHPA